MAAGSYVGLWCLSASLSDRTSRQKFKEDWKTHGRWVGRWHHSGHITMSLWHITSVLLATVYISPSAIADTAFDVISLVVAKPQTWRPNTFVAITDDFNYATLPNFQLFLSCCTREYKTFDLFYPNVKYLYISTIRPPLGGKKISQSFFSSL